MKYPKHLIVDIVPSSTKILSTPWVLDYSSRILENKPSWDTTFIQHKSFSKSRSYSVVTTSYGDNLFDIHFIRKERLYTKLKYSRCPQYDIVSGGLAALFAGFIGFLISEKFGIELVDSGDFYTAFMYVVFISFATRPLLRILSKNTSLTDIFTFKYAYLFYLDLLFLTQQVLMSYGRWSFFIFIIFFFTLAFILV